MTKTKDQILKQAKIKARQLRRLREDERYKFVMGRLKYEKLLDVEKVKARNYKLHLDDVLWVGENIEPRVLEVLPAILLKKPSLIYQTEIPNDLKRVKNKLKRQDSSGVFRGIPVKSLAQWITKTGRKDKAPTLSKTFRFRREDIERLKKLSEKFDLSETDVIRKAILKMS